MNRKSKLVLICAGLTATAIYGNRLGERWAREVLEGPMPDLSGFTPARRPPGAAEVRVATRVLGVWLAALAVVLGCAPGAASATDAPCPSQNAHPWVAEVYVGPGPEIKGVQQAVRRWRASSGSRSTPARRCA